MSRRSFSVGGQTFSISRELLDSGPNTRLSTIATKGNEPVELDRPRDSFGAILNLYITGELHIPPNVCPGEFKKEMEYWKIDVQSLSDCCFFRYQSFLEEQAALSQFRNRAFKSGSHATASGCFGKVRSRVWTVIDYRERTIISKIYFILCLLMVFLSILTLALSTDRTFQRSMTNCERLEYMESANMADIELFRQLLGQNCQSEELPNKDHGSLEEGRLPMSFYPPDLDYNYDDYEDNENDDYEYINVDDFFLPPLEVPNFNETDTNDNISPPLVKGQSKIIKVPNMKVPIYTMFILEIVTIVFFTTDLTLRLCTCPSFISYFKSVVNILDAVALVCTYFHYLVIFLNKEDMFKGGWINVLEYVQILRALRLLRVVKNVKASRVLIYSFSQNMRDLSIICIYIVVCMCVFGSIFYIAEGKKNIKSIPKAWYYTIITLTTVGYGDISPTTGLGRVVSCFCAVSGLLLFALTIPILANNFLTLYKYAYTAQRVEYTVSKSDKQTVEKKKNIEGKI